MELLLDEMAPQFFDAAPDALVLVDADGQIQLANARVEQLFQWDKESLRGTSIDLLLPERYRPKHGAHRARFFADPKPRGMGPGLDLWGLRRDGSEFPVEISLSPVRTSKGLFVLAAVRDISRVRRANEMFRGLIEAAPDAMVIVDSQGTIRILNQQAERLFGYARAELVGQPVETLVPTGLREAHVRHREGFMNAPQPRPMGAALQLLARRRDGTDVPVEISLSPLITDEGPLVTAAIRDISERRVAEKELAHHVAALDRSNRELERFAYVASHDLQEPMRVISNYVGLISKQVTAPAEPETTRWMNYVTEAAQRMQDLIRDLLAYSRIQASDANFRAFDVSKALDEALGNLSAARSESKAKIVVSPLPSLVGDARQLSLIFQNLLGNAIKFHKPGQVPNIEVGTRPDGGGHLFWVRDDGIGFDPKHKDKIFEIFQRLHSRDQYPGTGIGLSICQRIVNLHHGRIWADSMPGAGSTFWVWLPKDPRAA